MRLATIRFSGTKMATRSTRQSMTALLVATTVISTNTEMSRLSVSSRIGSVNFPNSPPCKTVCATGMRPSARSWSISHA